MTNPSAGDHVHPDHCKKLVNIPGDRPRYAVRWRGSLLTSDRAPKLVGAVWVLLLINTLSFTEAEMVVPFPRQAAQLVTMGSLALALVLAVVLNRLLLIRPNPFLLLLSLLMLLSVGSSLWLENGIDSLFRCFRFGIFVTTLWLTTRWWRGDLTFVRHTLRFLVTMLLSTLVGLMISPDSAMSGDDNRLVGTLWPMAANRVGQFAAVTVGLVFLLTLCRRINGRIAACVSVIALSCLILSHSRTALLGLIVGLVAASLSLLFTKRRVRLILTAIATVTTICVAVLWSGIQEWFQRGQDAELLGSLTGRQRVWNALLAEDRSANRQLFGMGLGDKSYHGGSIDSGWLAVYVEQGYLGISVIIVILVCLLGSAVARKPTPERACAIFLVFFCGVSSYSETGLGDASPYLLYLAVAASLLQPPPAEISVAPLQRGRVP